MPQPVHVLSDRLFIRINAPYRFGRYPSGNGIGRNIPVYHRARRNDGIVADGHSLQELEPTQTFFPRVMGAGFMENRSSGAMP